ncbi:MAG: hypothetical protein V4678_02350 [Patescibacteria group bacterium]
MSEIYNRSMGLTFNPDALAHELGNGTAGYDTTLEEPVYLGASDLMLPAADTYIDELYNERMQWNMVEATNGELSSDERADVVLLETEIVFREYEQRMAEVAVEHPKYTWHVGQILSKRLDEMKQQGHPVDAEMYVEAQDLASEIVAANPEKDAEELSQVVTTMVEMIQAEYRMRQLVLAA